MLDHGTAQLGAQLPGGVVRSGDHDVVLAGTPSEVKFAADSLLEGAGFEPSFPRKGQHFFETAADLATTNRPGSHSRILTIDKGMFTVR
jgi:hypothetical protein